MTKLETLIQEVLELDKKATPGEWRFSLDTPSIGYLHSNKIIHGEKIYVSNGELIAHYRTSSPKLAKALQVAIEALRELERFENRECTHHYKAEEALTEIEKILQD